MRREFDTTCDLINGPGAAAPGVVRVAGAACRVVIDDFFVDTQPPLDACRRYFTISAAEPRGPTNIDLTGDKWRFDFTFSDRVVFASIPATTWQVQRVERCTWPGLGSPYWRASIIVAEVPVTACQAGYAEHYVITDNIGVPEANVYRPGVARWEGVGWALTAENGATDPSTCQSLWFAEGAPGLWYGLWAGISPTLFDSLGGPFYQRSVYVGF